MNTPHSNNIAATGLRGWWAHPPRSGMRRLINPIAYRHPRALGGMHIAGGILAAVAGVICLAYGVSSWAAFFLVLGALNLAGGYWYVTIARDPSPRT
jgi:uncharacterized membrane protein HdeD (DUF308 family)